MDKFPVTVSSPLLAVGSLRFARVFTHDDRLYIAEGMQRGRQVTRVTSYDLPEGEPQLIGNQTRWGSWVWSSCGCGSSWGSHSVQELVSLAESVPA